MSTVIMVLVALVTEVGLTVKPYFKNVQVQLGAVIK